MKTFHYDRQNFPIEDMKIVYFLKKTTILTSIKWFSFLKRNLSILFLEILSLFFMN